MTYKELLDILCGGALLLFGAWLVRTGIFLEKGKKFFCKLYILAGFSVMACLAAAVFRLMYEVY
ncbi:MAG: hypothetical protein OSJ44_04660 [Lachnospiraceae bacterium]|nr:hypothetical protein [Lachnospiraceae bacterium]